MPELPDITVYVESLDAKVRGATLNRLRIHNPFLRGFQARWPIAAWAISWSAT